MHNLEQTLQYLQSIEENPNSTENKKKSAEYLIKWFQVLPSESQKLLQQADGNHESVQYQQYLHYEKQIKEMIGFVKLSKNPNSTKTLERACSTAYCARVGIMELLIVSGEFTDQELKDIAEFSINLFRNEHAGNSAQVAKHNGNFDTLNMTFNGQTILVKDFCTKLKEVLNSLEKGTILQTLIPANMAKTVCKYHTDISCWDQYGEKKKPETKIPTSGRWTAEALQHPQALASAA